MRVLSLTALVLLVLGGALATYYSMDKDTLLYQDEGEEESKYDRPDQYLLHYNAIRTKPGEQYPSYGNNYLMEALDKANRSSAAFRVAETHEFIERGPSNVPGRTRAILVGPSDATNSTWLAASVGGGIWKTTNKGQNWTLMTKQLPNLAFNCLAYSKSNPKVIYAGTGEGFGSSSGFIKGNGIFKTEDGGASWSQLISTVNNNDFNTVNRIIVDPNDPNVVLTCTNNDPNFSKEFRSSIFKSKDGGKSWYKVQDASRSYIQQLLATPGNFNVLYAAENRFGVYKSVDAGETWVPHINGMAVEGRIEIAISEIDPNRLYASAVGSQSGKSSDIYISEDAAKNWYVMTKEIKEDNIDFLGGQGWYDNTIVVHPFNEDIVYVGGVNLWKFTYQKDKGEVNLGRDFIGAVEDNTLQFMNLTTFNNGEYYNNKIGKGSVSNDEFTSIEVRFGLGKSQKAHRFLVPEGAGPGVSADKYTYQDYVDVPFEVWDTDHNKQLMVSFRDQQRDGKFNLREQNTTSGDEANHAREYVYIHVLGYDPNGPDANIAKAGGQEYKQVYFIWPYLTDGAVWEPSNLPESKFEIHWGEKIQKIQITTNVSDAYGKFSKKNMFTQLTGSTKVTGLHPDHHSLQAIVTSGADKEWFMLNTNDGGIYYSNVSTVPGEADGSWNNAGITYNTTQFYFADKAPGQNRYIGGAQDNGTWFTPFGKNSSSTTQFQRCTGGDGFGVVWHANNPDLLLASSYNNDILKSTNGGSTFQASRSGITDTVPFITRIENVKSEPDLVFTIGESGVWRSDNFAASWKKATINGKWTYRSYSQVKISLADANYVWAGSSMQENKDESLFLSKDKGVTFSKVKNYTKEEMGPISGLATHPFNRNEVFALFSYAKSPKVLRSYDLGNTWTDISGLEGKDESTNGFPDVAVYDLVVLPTDTSTIWAGTEIGIFESTDNGQSWHRKVEMPAASIWDFTIADDQIVMATHGRGIWSVTLSGAPVIGIKPEVAFSATDMDGNAHFNYTTKAKYDSLRLYIDGKLTWSNKPTDKVTKSDLSVSGDGLVVGVQHKLAMKGYLNGVEYSSDETEFFFYKYSVPVKNIVEDFDNRKLEFAASGFKVDKEINFDNNALHTKHFYEDAKQYVALILNPIIVDGNFPEIAFREVVIVEPGNDGSKFGDATFRDYVVVEYSYDGLDWKPLLDGYDASERASWKEKYQLAFSGDASNFNVRRVNLTNKLQPNDTVAVRFRLYSNESNNGWGWAIDDLHIQEKLIITSLDDNQGQVTIYPSPSSNGVVSVKGISKESVGIVNLYNTQGKAYKAKTWYADGEIKIDTYSLPKGMYILNMVKDNKVKVNKAFVID